jgi:hypothetical protein
MRITSVLSCIGAMAIAGSLITMSPASDASTTKVDLGIAGARVGGYTAGQAGMVLPVSFTMTNHSGSSTNVAFVFTVTNASVTPAGFVCPTTSTGLDILTDGMLCEPGDLAGGKSTRAVAMVTPTIQFGTVTVRACARSLISTPDPVSSNNCRTVSIPIV